MEELEVQQAAADVADKKMREQCHEERKENWDEGGENLRRKFYRDEK